MIKKVGVIGVSVFHLVDRIPVFGRKWMSPALRYLEVDSVDSFP